MRPAVPLLLQGERSTLLVQRPFCSPVAWVRFEHPRAKFCWPSPEKKKPHPGFRIQLGQRRPLATPRRHNPTRPGKEYGQEKRQQMVKNIFRSPSTGILEF